MISCGARLAPFDIAELREIMSYDEMELDMVGDQRTALFIIISDTDDTFNFVVAMMYSQLFNLLCDRADDVHHGRLPYHVRILADEFANIGQIPKFTFDVNSNFDFSNTKPGEMIFVGEHTKVSSWADLLAKTMNTAFDLDAETITDLATKDYSIPYATRIYISNDERKIRKPKQIDNSGIYFEANLSANGIISFIKDLLAKLQLDTDDFSFSLSEVPFDIDNEDTWAEGLIPVAKLFYNFVENLVEKGLIDSAELENLKTKEYTKNLFQATDYPAIANSRTDNMGNSLQKRYRAKAINFNGTDIYVSTQFFDSDRDAVIDWYRSHL